MEKRQEGTARVWIEAILIALIFLRFANTFVVQTFYIPSSSMEETLLVGDHLFVNRFIYGPSTSSLERAILPQRDVQRGDILVFRSVEEPIDVVKRCVAVAGDTVQVSSKQLYVNGERAKDQAYAIHRDPTFYPDPKRSRHPLARRDNYGPLVVPEDHVFCLGDNRDASHDSRFWGPLPIAHVKGRAFLIYWSYGGDVPDGKPQKALDRLAQVGKTLVGIPFKTRWRRTFRLIR